MLPAPLLLLVQVATVLAAARALGRLVQYVGQPQVVGEMTAGIALGPSLLGIVAPRIFGALFPPAHMTGLVTVSQWGLCAYMFLVGAELDVRGFRQRARATLVTSVVSIVVPLALGMLLATALYERVPVGAAPRATFTLFMGAAMCVTAFPVLARMLAERGWLRTPLGTAALSCAAVDDVAAWVVLAIVAGVHGAPLFAAFMIGAVVPRGAVRLHACLDLGRRWLSWAILPVFFAVSGLRTQVTLIRGAALWLVTAAIILTAVVGKLGGCAVAARATGMSWRDATALGTLMNTRGLMELVILNVGLNAGAITPTVFAMMVLMALGTTVMTSPLLALWKPRTL